MEVLVALPKEVRRVKALPLLSLGGRSILVIQLAFLHHQGMSVTFVINSEVTFSVKIVTTLQCSHHVTCRNVLPFLAVL